MLDIARALAAIPAAMLPRRYWPAIEEFVPVSQGSIPAAVVTLLAGLMLGIQGFLAHLGEVASQNNIAYLEAAQRVKGDTLPLPSAVAALAVFTFILFTPQGWLSTYLALSGLVRMVGAILDDPHGDFVLTISDAAIRNVRERTTRRASASRRLRLEGPPVRDRCVPGARVGMPQADVVVVASRVKEDWGPGAVVLSDRGEFRILEVKDETIDGRLRRLYALARHTDLEVFRRTVRYEFPRERGEGDTRAAGK
jgi:hypothetical protein